METIDMRKLTREARHERRVQVIRLRKAGRTYDEIATLTGLSRTGVFDICKRHAASGSSALHDAAGGRKLGEQRLLSPAQEALVQKLIADKTPDQLKMPYALWSRAAVAELIEQRFGLKLKVRTMGMYLQRWGFTPQKPMRKAYEQSPAAVKKWLDEDYPALAQRARAEGTEIHWGDESGLRSDDVRGRSYAPRGETPVVRVPNKRHGLSIISTVTNKGQMRWRIFDGALNSTILIDFFKRLIKGQKKKVFLILDNLRVHHSKPVKHWLAQHAEYIEVFYLPSYSPELNPDEMANADLKQAVTKLAPARTKLQLVKATARHLRSVQRQPQRIKKYFEHDPVRYAA
ncbi:MAG: IS630 family transposase [Rhodocyclaceae bacterium]|uniref:IS630 family transposase n=1 Tax=Aquidulcibacter sp. TaxID=2052990 RepID=UPI0025C54619|nr:IS630 family transposase [Aquidulcibacter sp.]MCA3000684.1 IS630 family transposase [Rhodocyclaceae bacterium]MCA3035122.1 IS630 family transposase [Rhodocyclaceae bacterium]MCA3052845.1 IS630 family transposase [Rhodocyclaceae bacterium]MCA3086216.1 IS630 family transposase [Rhodocyclaceae bacterium]MCA3694592.1 IS630 family transposase [Aquidulcibacter sp.]